MAKFILPGFGKAKGNNDELPHAVNTDLIAHIGRLDNVNSITPYSIVFYFGSSTKTVWTFETKDERDAEWDDVRKELGFY